MQQVFWDVAVPWLRRLVAETSSRRPGFALEIVHVGFVAEKVEMDQVPFSPSSSILLYQYHSTVILHTHISSEG
jgi:hypothetical protein